MGNKPQKPKQNPNYGDLAKKFKVSVEEIRDLEQMYKDSCDGNPHLTKKQFQDVYAELFPGDATDFANVMFQTFDSDGNGFVDVREFIIGLLMSDSQNMEEKIRFAFDMYDQDKNGEISYEEVKFIAQAHVKMYKLNDTGEEIARKLFGYMDKNNDQSISRAEFNEAARSKPEVMNLLFPKPPDED